MTPEYRIAGTRGVISARKGVALLLRLGNSIRPGIKNDTTKTRLGYKPTAEQESVVVP